MRLSNVLLKRAMVIAAEVAAAVSVTCLPHRQPLAGWRAGA